jgi:hypothetical protein
MPRELDAFLYATLGEEPNGMLLTIATVLARRGLDPGAEAHRLALLPRAAAARRMAQLLRPLAPSEPDAEVEEVEQVAARLVELLPSQPDPAPTFEARPRATVAWLICLVLLSAVLFAVTARSDMSPGRALLSWAGYLDKERP